jgi:hypothetical protein
MAVFDSTGVFAKQFTPIDGGLPGRRRLGRPALHAERQAKGEAGFRSFYVLASPARI